MYRSIRYTLGPFPPHEDTMSTLPFHGRREHLTQIFFTLLIATTFLF